MLKLEEHKEGFIYREANRGVSVGSCARIVKTVPIIHLSGFASDSDVQKGLEAGACAYLGEPVSYEY